MHHTVAPNNITFTARCSQIRDAQWVCQKVRSFPHISSTYWGAHLEKLEEQNPEIYNRFINQSSINRYIPKEPNALKIVKIFSWHKKLVRKINRAREEWNIGGKNSYRKVDNILGQFKYEKLGNCGEDAYLAASILRMNGVENACVTRMRIDSNWQDHVVCLFNKDGSSFDGKNLKKAIVIDPWLGIADFASNMSVKYKNLFQEMFCSLMSNSDISFQKIDKIDLSDQELQLLKLKYPNLCFPKKSNRKFMQ